MSRIVGTRSEVIKSNELHEELTSNDSRLILIEKNDNTIYAFYIENGRLANVYSIVRDSDEDKIILSRVINVKNDIGAVFVKLDENTDAFCKITNVPDRYKPIKQGDLLPVKIISDSQKGKRISVTAKVGKKHLPFGYEHLSAYNVLYEPENGLWAFICKRLCIDEIGSLLTESEAIYNELSEYTDKIKLYNDDKISLNSLYSLKTKLNDALCPKIYLKCGAYLIINHTEALTVIDVNSGKKISKTQSSDDNNLNINIEAAEEIAFQMKLRNISGMILVDFINMENEEAKDTLIKKMTEFTEIDKVTTKVIDITPLGIMEITRQKTDKPISELNIEL
ncbi:MAG: ribonuclease E/G [Lachnospiraceae bacterium]|nr:ribonuclease E/G [Lachnospiraceae bacterium]